VLDACLKQNIGELVLASSSEVYQIPPTIPTDETVPLSIPDPLNPRYSYAAGKIISEIMALNYGIKHFERVVIFRPHNVYGPDMGWQHVIPQFVIRMKSRFDTSPAEEIDFPIQGSGQETRAFVFIEDFTDGLMLVIEHGEHRTIYNIGTREELSIAEVAHRVATYFNRRIRVVPGPLMAGGTTRRCPDITRLRQFGYEPHFSFDQGLAIAAAWYAANADKAHMSVLSSER
jgi:nucleoside-diphosphate-sugar epimerase